MPAHRPPLPQSMVQVRNTLAKFMRWFDYDSGFGRAIETLRKGESCEPQPGVSDALAHRNIVPQLLQLLAVGAALGLFLREWLGRLRPAAAESLQLFHTAGQRDQRIRERILDFMRVG